MDIAMIGTRGVPARYGGFETAVEEIGERLVQRGHQVRVYCRNPGQSIEWHRGMRLVNLPTLRSKVTDTLAHTALSLLHCRRHPVDAAIVFNAANAPLLPLLGGGTPVAVHVDGLESRRSKWGRIGRAYYMWAEGAAVRRATVLIADAVGISSYYQQVHGARTTLLRYGMPAPVAEPVDSVLAALSLRPGGYYLVVARMEPENHVLEAVSAHRRTPERRYPLVVVGDAPYASGYKQQIATASSAGVRLIGSVWEAHRLDALYAGARVYVHGHSVGGTNPSLLRAIAQGAAVFAHDNVFNVEVAGTGARYWSGVEDLSQLFDLADRDYLAFKDTSVARQHVMRDTYNWDVVAEEYEAMLTALAASQAAR